MLAEVGKPARVRGRTGPPNFIVEMFGISQKKSNFGNEKVGFSEVKLHGRQEPGSKSETCARLWGSDPELGWGEVGGAPCVKSRLLHGQS